jgi:phage terminase small subunit
MARPQTSGLRLFTGLTAELICVGKEEKKKSLTKKEGFFVLEYLVDLNATEAAKRAGYAAKSAASIGSELLQKPHIAAAVKEATDKRSAKLGITADFVLAGFHNIANVDIANAYDENGKLLPIHKIPVEVRKAIAGAKITNKTREVEILKDQKGNPEKQITTTSELSELKFWNKVDALKAVGEHLQMFIKKIELSGKVEIDYAGKIAKARARIGKK